MHEYVAHVSTATSLPGELSGSSPSFAFAEQRGLDHFPSELLERRDLTRIVLFGNRLTTIPAEVANLDRLEYIDLSANSIARLPVELGLLKRLEYLDLGGNRLTELPDSVSNLVNLRVLDVRENQLTSLPPGLAPMLRTGQLTIRCEDNPLDEALAGAASRGALSLAMFLSSLGDGVPQYEAKVVLVGEGNVGKTSLVARLIEDEFVSRPTTHGIQIREFRLPSDERDQPSVLRTWDFGGQEVYRATHPFFYSRHALYLVVWHAREGPDRNRVEEWIRQIRVRVATDAAILVVATHADERRPDIDYQHLRSMFGSMLRGSYAVDSASGRGVHALRKAVGDEADRLPQMGRPFSRRWASARDGILTIASTEAHITYDVFAHICVQYGVTDEELPHLAQLLHDLGQIIYFGDDDGLRDIVVLNPEWLTGAISLVLDDADLEATGGILEHSRLRQIWAGRGDGPAYPAEQHPFFLRLMEKFDICYRLAGESRSLIAQLVPYARPLLPWSATSPLRQGHRVLRLICELEEPTAGLIPMLTVRHHDCATGNHWRRGVFLRHFNENYDSEALIELQSDRRLAIEVRAPSPSLFFSVLWDSLENVLARRWPGLGHQLYVPCPGTEGRQCNGKFPLNGLMRFRERASLGEHSAGSIADTNLSVRSTLAYLDSGGGRGKEGQSAASRIPCLDCQGQFDVAELLTGFPTAEHGIGTQLDRLEADLTAARQGVGRLEATTERLASHAADSANSLRLLVRAAAAETIDCPRLFTVSPRKVSFLERLKPGRRPFTLMLWCEQAGAWHPWTEGSYRVEQTDQWLQHCGPYIKLVLRALHVAIPFVSAIADVAVQSWVDLDKDLRLMRDLVQSLPDLPVEEPQFGPPQPSALSLAEGSALRAFRSLILALDPAQVYGGLRRVLASSGEYLWVCPHHRRLYDPGLPSLE
jgi:hypothetical protein